MVFRDEGPYGNGQEGLTHSLVVTDAAQADIKQMPDLLHGEEREVYGDQAYWKEADREEFERRGVRYRVNRRGNWANPLSERWRMINRARSRVRARGEHGYHVVKRLWGFSKVRYRGLAKNRAGAPQASRTGREVRAVSTMHRRNAAPDGSREAQTGQGGPLNP